MELQLFVKIVAAGVLCWLHKHQDISLRMLPSGIRHQALDTNTHTHVVQQFCCTLKP